MPDLEAQVVTEWFAELRPADCAAWPPAIRPIEAGGQAPGQLAALGAALDELAPAGQVAAAVLDDRLVSGLRSAMAQMGAARTLRLLHWLAERDLPGCHDLVARLTQGSDAGAAALRSTIDAVTRAATIRRMFAPERIAALELACTTNQEMLA